MVLKVKIIRSLIFISLAFIVLFASIIYFSPYGKYEHFDYKLILATKEIDKSPNHVYEYLGDSGNASEWSVFVDHIITLNGDEVADGNVGSERRCFKNANRKGLRWDEEIVEIIPTEKRRLTIYNLVDFPMTADGIETEQLYERIGENRCKLSFSVFYNKDQISWWDDIRMYFAAFFIKNILDKNLSNIKFHCENHE